MSTLEPLDKGMKCLRDGLGNIESEELIERFDYTKWRENLYDGMNLEELNSAAVKYENEHPFQQRAKIPQIT